MSGSITSAPQTISLRILNEGDVELFRALRLEGLHDSPAAFGQTAEEFGRMSHAELVGWIGPTQDKFIVGAFDEGLQMVGVMAINRQSQERVCHKGKLWGVYVKPTFRGKGLSKRLFQRVLDDIDRIPGLK